MRALRALFEQWYPRLVRHLHARLGDADQAEDIAQEAFVRLVDAAPRNPGAWLFTVAENLARDHARVARGRATHLTLIGGEMGGACDPGPERPLLDAEEAARVRQALAALPERDRALLLLHQNGVRYRAIADELNVAPSSVGSLLTRAQRRLAQSYTALEGPADARHASR